MTNGRWLVIGSVAMCLGAYAGPSAAGSDQAEGLTAVALSKVMLCAQGKNRMDSPSAPAKQVFHCENTHPSALAVCRTDR